VVSSWTSATDRSRQGKGGDQQHATKYPIECVKTGRTLLKHGKDTENSSDDYKGNTEGDIRQLVIPDEQGGQRLDQALSALLPEFSRNRIQNWIRARKIAVDDNWGTTRMKVCGGEAVRVEIEPDPGATPDAPEAIPLDVVFEDPVLLVINKPSAWWYIPAAAIRAARC